jgi:hypothetical protein
VKSLVCTLVPEPGCGFALDGTNHASHKEQASMIRRYIIWRNNHAYDERLRRSRLDQDESVAAPGASVRPSVMGGSLRVLPAARWCG